MNITYIVKKILFVHLCFFLAGIPAMMAQENMRSISGLVLDEAQNPLVGATIKLEGSDLGTISGIEGTFELSVPDDSNGTLIISFVGYITEEIAISGKTNIEVTLIPDLQQVDEVLVVAIGYGNMRKSDLTGAIATVSSDELKKGVISSSEQLLRGKVAGLTVIQGTGDPASGASLRLRGGTSLTASNSPLIVVDGIPGVDINTIQPSEIVSVDVLKDASAAAIYGSREQTGLLL
jgi:iron complex outermembrane receptor protein